MTSKGIFDWCGVHCVDSIYHFEEPSYGNMNVVHLNLAENNIIGILRTCIRTLHIFVDSLSKFQPNRHRCHRKSTDANASFCFVCPCLSHTHHLCMQALTLIVRVRWWQLASSPLLSPLSVPLAERVSWSWRWCGGLPKGKLATCASEENPNILMSTSFSIGASVDLRPLLRSQRKRRVEE